MTDQNTTEYQASGGYVAPIGYSVTENIQVAQEVGTASDGYLWFYEQVRPGGAWDYKRTNDGTGEG